MVNDNHKEEIDTSGIHKIRYRYDMIGAYKSGVLDHPQTVIRRIAPDAYDFEPKSIGDCWEFTSSPIQDCPDYVRVLRTVEWVRG